MSLTRNEKAFFRLTPLELRLLIQLADAHQLDMEDIDALESIVEAKFEGEAKKQLVHYLNVWDKTRTLPSFNIIE